MCDVLSGAVDPGLDLAAPGPRLLALGGSRRDGSLTEVVLRTALALAEVRRARPLSAFVRDLALPPFDPEWRATGLPAGPARLVALVRAADAIILASPTYHGTLSGEVKTAIDWLQPLGDEIPSYFGGRPVGLIALGSGAGSNVVTALTHASRALRGLVVPTTVIVPGEAVDPIAVAVRDPAVTARLTVMVEELLDLTCRLRSPASQVSLISSSAAACG